MDQMKGDGMSHMNDISGERAFHFEHRFMPREIELIYSGGITAEGIRALADYVEASFSIYQPSKLTVAMRSPGGQVSALNFWVRKLTRWREQGIEVSTEADTICASAAALIVALGALGHRSAHSLSRLLYHYARFSARDITLLEHDAEDLARTLKHSRGWLHSMLRQHCVDGLGPWRFARTLHKRAAWLVEHTAELKGFSSAATTWRGKKELQFLQEWAAKRPDTGEEAESLIEQWVEQLDDLFHRDQFVELPVAWAMFLIDTTETLPVIVEDEPMADPEIDQAAYAPCAAEGPSKALVHSNH